METNKFEDIERIKEAWKQAIDPDVIKAATEDWEEYPPHVQTIIEAEARNRGLWEKVLYLRGEISEFSISSEGHLEGYVCDKCKGTQLNPDTGRCSKCNFPIDGFGFCKTCREFFSIPPGRLCPKDGTKLIRSKVPSKLIRFGNDIFDMAVGYVVAVLVLIFVISFGFVESDFFANIDPITDRLITMTLMFFYYFISEVIWQRTPAKFVTGTKVITVEGTKPSIGTIAKRTLIRFIPFEAFSFLGDETRGWHDKWSGTYVVKAKRFDKVTHYKKYEEETIGVEAQNEKIIVAKRLLLRTDSEPMMSGGLGKCSHCKRTIGKLEHSYKIEGNIICVKCHQVLNS